MFEISLVPEVKAKLLHQERIRNWVVFICIIVACGCGGIIAILVGINLAQGVQVGALDKEIACRLDGKLEKGGTCESKYKVPIMKTENLTELLSIQNEMNNVGVLNDKKAKPSRFFDMMTVLLPQDQVYRFQTSELSLDVAESTLTYDIVGRALHGDNEEYRSSATSYANFKQSINSSFYDKGDYYIVDKDGNEEKIPTYCISENFAPEVTEDDGGNLVRNEENNIENGELYGVYHRYTPGCEAPMLTETKEGETPKTTVPSNRDIYIRRTYANSKDMSDYRLGSNPKETYKLNDEKRPELDKDDQSVHFYFKSDCAEYTDEGIDEKAWLTNCPIAAEKVVASEKSSGFDEDGNEVFNFTTSIKFSADIFSQSSHHVAFFLPSRRNVSDSYRATEKLFTSAVNLSDDEENDKETK